VVKLQSKEKSATQIAADLGMSESMASYVLQQIADVGLVAKAPNNRWYAVPKDEQRSQ
jgi:biotin operon repressor